MPSEGERGDEERENPERDPFAGYAEELEGKQRGTEDTGELDQGAPDSAVTPSQQPAESTNAEVNPEQDEFEAYAKELKNKYEGEEGGTDSPRVERGSSRVEAEPPSQEDQISTRHDGQAPDSQNHESANPSAQPAMDSTSIYAPSDPVDKASSVGSETDEEPRDSAPRPGASPGSNFQNDSQPDKPRPEDAERLAPRPIETYSQEQHDSPETNEQTDENGKQELGNPNHYRATDSAVGDPPLKQIDVGDYQQDMANLSRNLPNIKSDTEHSADSPHDEPDFDKAGPRRNVSESGLDEQSMPAQPVNTEITRDKEGVGKFVPDKGSTTNPETIHDQDRMHHEEQRQIPSSEAPVPSTSITKDGPRRKLESETTKEPESSSGRNPAEEGEKHKLRINRNQTEEWVNISTECLRSTGLDNGTDIRKKDIVLEIRARIAGEEQSKRFFRTYNPEAKDNFRLEFDRHTARVGDSFEVIQTRAHTVDSFVEEFMRVKPKGLDNVDLVNDNRGLKMRVDGNEYQIHNPHLIACSRRAELSGTLMPAERKLRFWLTTDETTVMIGQHPIARMSVSNHVLDVTYWQSVNDAKVHHFRYASVVEGKAAAASAFERGGHFTMAIPRRLFREASGKLMEVGKEYVIQGRVLGICEFNIHHFETEKSARSSKMTLFLGKEAEGKLKPREKYGVVIDSVSERRDFRVMGKRSMVEINEPSMNSLGLSVQANRKNEIIELPFKNMARPGATPARYFVNSKPDANRIVLELGKTRGKRGDVLRIENPRRYVIRQFVNEFKSHKPESLKNVDLDLNKDHITMYVDGKRILLREPQLVAYGLQAKLTANIETTGRKIIFYFDGERVSSRLFRFHQIQSMKTSDTGLEIAYFKDRKESRTFLLRFDPFDNRVLDGNVKLVSRPKGEDSSYHFRVSPSLRDYLESKLNRLREDLGKYGHRTEKGNISEEIQHHLLSMIPGWEKVAEHPFNTSLKVDSARKVGPDSIYRLKEENELDFVEMKWDNEPSDAFSAGSKQIRKYLSKYPVYNMEAVKGGYVGIINWDIRSRDLFFYLRKVDTARVSPKQT